MIRRPPRSTRTDTRVPYTPLFRSGLIANMALYKNLPYDLIKDFQPVSRIARIPNVLVVGANNKAGSLQARSEEHTSELQSLMRISYAVFCLKQKTDIKSLQTRAIGRKNH